MLDFFRDVALDLIGIDSQKKKQLRTNKKKYIFSSGTKRIIYFLGILYLVMGGLSVWSIKGNGQIFTIIKFVFLSVIDVAALVCLSIKTKKTEIIAFILIAVFIVIMYLTTMILIY